MAPQIEQVAVAALVRANQALLVHRHPERRWYPDCWDLVGGHIEHGESPVEAIRRECEEEIGVQIRTPHPFPLPFSDPLIDMHAFLVTSWDGEPTNCAPDEHDDLQWFTADDLPKLTLADPASLPAILALIKGLD